MLIIEIAKSAIEERNYLSEGKNRITHYGTLAVKGIISL